MKAPDDVIAAAQAAERKYGILASIQLAQWAQESAWGAKVTGTFNFFGVKATAGQPFTLCATHEVVHGITVEIKAPFRNFASLQDAFDHHALLLATGGAFAAGWKVRGDFRAYAQAIGPHYATDPDYAAELIHLIESEGFAAYDDPSSVAWPPAGAPTAAADLELS